VVKLAGPILSNIKNIKIEKPNFTLFLTVKNEASHERSILNTI